MRKKAGFAPVLGMIAYAFVASAACGDGLPPLSEAESGRGLAPITGLKVGCYDASRSRGEGRIVELEFELRVDERGQVESELLGGDASDEELVGCLQRGFGRFVFPAGRRAAEIRLKFELVPPRGGVKRSGVLE